VNYNQAKAFARELRKNQTEAETEFWNQVRNSRFRGLKFTRLFLVLYKLFWCYWQIFYRRFSLSWAQTYCRNRWRVSWASAHLWWKSNRYFGEDGLSYSEIHQWRSYQWLGLSGKNTTEYDEL